MECIPVDKGNFHNTCTCIIHENFDLLLLALGNESSLQSFLNHIPCNSKAETCMMGLCALCPNSEKIEELFGELDSADEVIFYQWRQTDGTEMVQIQESVESFKHRFKAMLPKLLYHHFLVRKQNLFVCQWKEEHLSHPTEALVHVDFAQNYSFVFQDEVQSSHWSHKQATVHPFLLSIPVMNLDF